MAERRLQDLFLRGRIRSRLLPPGEWRPYPGAEERELWRRLDGERGRRLRERAEGHLGRSWPELPATLYAEFRRDGNRTRYQSRYYERRTALADLALAECVEADGRFLDDAVNGIWAICEESTWCVPAHERSVGRLSDPRRPWIDLFGAETGALLAWVGYLLEPVLEREFPEVPERIRYEVRRRLLEPYRCDDDWHWLRGRDGRGPNNWNPWIHSNLLVAALLVEDDVELRASLVARMVRGIDAFWAGYAGDGGCDEGASYWWRAAASLLDCLELLRSASAGRLDGFDLPRLREMARFFHHMHVHADWYVNFGDAPARILHSGEPLYRYGALLHDPEIQEHALAMRAVETGAERDHDLTRRLAALFDDEYWSAPAPSAAPRVRDSWYEGIQVLTARQEAGESRGLFLAAKAGDNGASHNHNDVGSFIVAVDGFPVLIDVGPETYTARTFGPDRYRIWPMRSAFHNLPLIDGREQEAGVEHGARSVRHEIGDAASRLTMDIAPAYPEAAGVRRWERRLALDRAGEGQILVEDEYELERAPEELALHLMSWPAPEHPEPGRLRYPSRWRSLYLEYDPALLSVRIERIDLDDPRLTSVWGDAVHRTVLEVTAPPPPGCCAFG